MQSGLFQPIFAYFHRERPEEYERARQQFFQSDDYQSFTIPRETVDIFFGAWFLYDYRTKTEKKAPMDVYSRMNPDRQSAEQLQVLQAILKTQFFDAFEVVVVERDFGMILRQIRTGKEFSIKEKLGTRGIEKGMLQFCRLIWYKDVWELNGDALVLESSSPAVMSLKVFFDRMPKNVMPSARDVLRMLGMREEAPSSTLEGAKKALDQFFRTHHAEESLHAEKVVEWLQEIEDVPLVGKKCLLHFSLPSNDDLGILLDLISTLWNHLPSADRGAESKLDSWEPGPIEKSLLMKLAQRMQKDLDLDSFASQEEVDEAASLYQAQWIDIPLQSMNHRTPRQLVAEERVQGGHPEKDWTTDVSIQRMPDVRQQRADALYFEAHALLKKQQYAEAEKLYRTLVQEEPENYKAWGNLGVALSLQEGRKDEARVALHQALSIEPNYQVARDNLKAMKKKKGEKVIPTLLARASLLRVADPEDAVEIWMPLLQGIDSSLLPPVYDTRQVLSWLSTNKKYTITPKRREISRSFLIPLNTLLSHPDKEELSLQRYDGEKMTISFTHDYQFPTLHRLHHLLLAMPLTSLSSFSITADSDAPAFLSLPTARQYCYLLWGYCRELQWGTLVREDEFCAIEKRGILKMQQSSLHYLIDRLLSLQPDADGWIDLDQFYSLYNENESENRQSFDASSIFCIDGIRVVWQPLIWFGLLEGRIDTENDYGFPSLVAVRLTTLGEKILPTMGCTSSLPQKDVYDTQQRKASTPHSFQKIGRNDPCPCGAKKSDGTLLKYKHCCG